VRLKIFHPFFFTIWGLPTGSFFNGPLRFVRSGPLICVVQPKILGGPFVAVSVEFPGRSPPSQRSTGNGEFLFLSFCSLRPQLRDLSVPRQVSLPLSFFFLDCGGLFGFYRCCGPKAFLWPILFGICRGPLKKVTVFFRFLSGCKWTSFPSFGARGFFALPTERFGGGLWSRPCAVVFVPIRKPSPHVFSGFDTLSPPGRSPLSLRSHKNPGSTTLWAALWMFHPLPNC